jgi:hypothetical protein
VVCHDNISSGQSDYRGMKRASSLAVASAIALAACEQLLPTAPSELTTGIVVYEHANYLGQSAHVTKDIRDLKDFDAGPCVRSDTDASGASTTSREWNDCLSSVRLASGWRATVYRDPDFRGEALEIGADVSNLQLEKGSCDHGGFNDCITSIRLHPP